LSERLLETAQKYKSCYFIFQFLPALIIVRGIFSGTNNGSMQGTQPIENRVEISFILTGEFEVEGTVKHVQFDAGAFNAQLMAGE